MKLELQGITKRFGPLIANDSIDVTIEEGHIHALLGENGAGKSTLMNVLYGMHAPDEGQILIDGEPVTFKGPGDAVAAGIGMVHQHFMLIPVFTVAESIALGFEPTGPAGIISRERARQTVREVSARFGFDLDPDALIEDLPVGAQQRVEIVKALSRQAKVLILDEPTAVLTPQETDELMTNYASAGRRGDLDCVHHAQAARGARGGRRDHGDPPRSGRGARVPERVRGLVGYADGRA